MARSMLPIVYGCHTADYRPAEIWMESLRLCEIRGILSHHSEIMKIPRSLLGGAFLGDAWYWCTANKPLYWSKFLRRSPGLSILSDCDVIFFPSPVAWAGLVRWFMGQKLGVACHHEGNQFNSGFVMVKPSFSTSFASHLEVIYRKSSSTRLPFGDQTVLNELSDEIGIAAIPREFSIQTGFLSNSSTVAFGHAFGIIGTPVQFGAEPNDRFYDAKISNMLQMRERGNFQNGKNNVM